MNYNKYLIRFLKLLFWISTILAPIGYLNFLVIYHSVLYSFLSLIILLSISIFSIYEIDRYEKFEKKTKFKFNKDFKELISVPLSIIFGFCSLFVIMPTINENSSIEVTYLNLSRIIFPIILIVSSYYIIKANK